MSLKLKEFNMENKKRYILVSIIIMLLVILVGTYAWLTYRSNKTAMVLTIGDIDNVRVTLSPYQIKTEMTPVLAYTSADYVSVEAINNNNYLNNITLYYKINSIDSALVNSNFRYTIERSTDNGSTYSSYKTGNFSAANTTDDFVILTEDIPKNSTYKYKVYVWLYGSGGGQNNVQGKSFNGELNASINGRSTANLKSLNTGNFFRESNYKTKVTDIYFIYADDLPSGIQNNNIKTYNMGNDAGKLITGYLIENTDPGADPDTYKVYVSSDYKIYAGVLTSAFEGMTTLKSILFANFDTSNVTTMSRMFYGCSSLTSLNLNSFNTSNVQDMNSMFRGCSSLTSINLSSFNTSNVQDMSHMFHGCGSLTTLDVSNFNTSNVENMRAMFETCSGLSSLDISNFNTSSVTNMIEMFWYSTRLNNIYISDLWNVTGVTSSGSMFLGCTKLPNYSSSYTDKTRAYYGGDGLGYLTYKAYPSS